MTETRWSISTQLLSTDEVLEHCGVYEISEQSLDGLTSVVFGFNSHNTAMLSVQTVGGLNVVYQSEPEQKPIVVDFTDGTQYVTESGWHVRYVLESE